MKTLIAIMWTSIVLGGCVACPKPNDVLTVERVLPYVADRVWDIAYSPDGGSIAVATLGGHPSIYDAESGARQSIFYSPGGSSSVEYSPDGSMLLTAGSDGVRLYDLRTGQVRHVFNGWEGEVLDDGRIIWTGGDTNITTHSGPGLFKCWDSATGERVTPPDVWGFCVSIGDESHDLLNPHGFMHVMHSYAHAEASPPNWTNIDRRIDESGLQSKAAAVLTGLDPPHELKIVRWDDEHKQIPVPVTIMEDEIHQFIASFSADFTIMALLRLTLRLEEDRWVHHMYFVDALSGKIISSFELHASSVTVPQVSPDGLVAVIGVATPGSSDRAPRQLLLIRVDTGEILQKDEIHTAGLRAIAWSPSGDQLATGGMDGNVILWKRTRMPTRPSHRTADSRADAAISGR